MSSSRCSRLLLVLLVVLSLPVGLAAGVSVSDEATPTGAQVGASVEASYTLAELYRDPSFESWTLRGETELSNVTWTFELSDQAGNVVETNSVDGQNATQDVSIDEGVSEVTVRVVGEVPEVENFTYEPAPTFLVAALTHTREGGTSSTIETYEARHYTAESREARQAIESAQAAIDAAGGNAGAEETLGNAVSAYEAENFENAVSLAGQAEQRATQARQARQRNQLIVYGAVGVVVLLVVVGAVYWYANRDRGGTL